jgi:hypothetical protein
VEAGDWRQQAAESIEIKRGNGPLRGFLRGEQDGRTIWLEGQTREPGVVGPVVKDGERLTPQELLDSLRGPLGAG